ncbi:MAG: pyridoxal-dependent decarboxylase [Clostridia bacterium]|nr:pyridoxal-dependent decarboxylase [Clostridia bacterium]
MRINVGACSEKTEFQSLMDVLTDTDGCLSDDERNTLKSRIDDIDVRIEALEKEKLSLGLIYDYNDFKRRGATKEDIAVYWKDDDKTIGQCERFLQNNIGSHEYHFGYPLNMEDYTYLVQYLRYLESKTFLMNNCGDPYQGGNSRMDSKEIERAILRVVAGNFGLKVGEYWGYMTSGGTEGNYWAIREGFSRFAAEGKRARLYFSEDTHYSVTKFVSYGGSETYDHVVIPSNPDGSINVDALEGAIKRDIAAGYEGVILLLNWGTTCKGAVDGVENIVSFCLRERVPYYCHVDAALYGGIGSNQKDAPTIGDVKRLHIDSISLSLYKYVGAARINGVVLSLKERQSRAKIEYIGMEDSTFLGSRDCLPFSTYQRAVEILERTDSGDYRRNVEYFENLLASFKIPYERTGVGNIFVIDAPSDGVSKKFQLATFEGGKKAHVIIFPFHKKEMMDELAKALSEDVRG